MAKAKEDEKDILVVMDTSSGMADIAEIDEINHERIAAKGYSVPIPDTRAFTGKRGRIFVVNALPEATSDYRRIAELERSTVFKQITRYSDKPADQTVDFFKYVVMGIMAIIIVVLILSGGGN